jgi:two-component system nitrate/nitrite response regulator NarL
MSSASELIASSPDLIRVLVAARDGLTRAGLVALISDLPGLLLVGQTEDDEVIPADAELYNPDVVVWEASPGRDRFPFLRDIAVPVLAIVTDDETAFIAWSMGARGVVQRDVKPPRFAAAIRALAEGLSALDSRFADVPTFSNPNLPSVAAEALTDREFQVLQLVAEGLPNKSIAAKLRISEHTVKFHVNSILGKMRAQSRTQAVTTATRLGLIKL